MLLAKCVRLAETAQSQHQFNGGGSTGSSIVVMAGGGGSRSCGILAPHAADLAVKVSSLVRQNINFFNASLRHATDSVLDTCML